MHDNSSAKKVSPLVFKIVSRLYDSVIVVHRYTNSENTVVFMPGQQVSEKLCNSHHRIEGCACAQTLSATEW